MATRGEGPCSGPERHTACCSPCAGKRDRLGCRHLQLEVILQAGDEPICGPSQLRLCDVGVRVLALERRIVHVEGKRHAWPAAMEPSTVVKQQAEFRCGK